MIKRLTIVTAIISIVCAITTAVMLPYAVRQQGNSIKEAMERYSEFTNVGEFDWDGTDKLEIWGNYSYELVSSTDGKLRVESTDLETGKISASLLKTSAGWRLELNQGGPRYSLNNLSQFSKLIINEIERQHNTVRISVPNSIKEVGLLKYRSINTSPNLDVTVNQLSSITASDNSQSGEGQTWMAAEITSQTYQLSEDERLELNFDSGGYSKIVVDGMVGDIDVKPSEGNQILIQAEYDPVSLFDRPAPSMRISSSGGTLRFEVANQGGEGGLLSGLNRSDVGEVSIQLYVPSSITALDVQSDVGDIAISGQGAVMTVESSVGDIAMDSCRLLNGGKIISSVGEIALNNCRIEGAQQIKSEVGALSISAVLDEGSQVNAGAEIGDVDLRISSEKGWIVNYNGKRYQSQGEGGAIVNVTTELGDVTVTQN